jgi:murein DD-endopeptidase MepM/ murein hydrolase activator NlpD
MAKMISPLTGTLQSIKKQFISKEKLLKSTLNVQKKRIVSNRTNAERERFIDYEKVLERPLRSLGAGIKNVVGKRLGFLDTLKTFIVNLLLGFIALRLLKYLPQLIQFATTALKVGNFILDIGGKILNGLVTFVDYGYKAYDHARKIVGKVGGEKAVANLDKATDETTKVMNQLFIAAMLFSDFSPFAGLSGAPKAMEAAADAIKNKVSGEVANAATDAATKTAGKAALGPIGSAGIIIGAGLLFSAAGEGVFQLTKWTKGLIGFGPISKFFQVPLGILEGVGTLFDIVGAPFRYGIELVRAGFMKMFNMKDGLEKQSKNLGKFDARIRENFRRLSGVFAPVFSFFGQQDTAKKLSTPGSFGSLYGEKAVKDMGYSGGGKVISVRKYAAGGPVNIPRTEVKEVDIPRGETIKQAPTKPGASIGGKERFAEVFPDSGNDTSKMDRYGYMISSYDTISGIPDLGSVFALTTKALLGDQVTKDDYDRASSSLSSFMLLGLYETNPEAYQKFSSLIDIKQFNRSISGFLMKSMSMPLGGIINLLKIQVGLIPKPGEDADTTKTGDISSDSDMVEGSVPGGQLTMEQLVGLAKGAGFSDGDAVIMAAIAKGESGGNSNAKNFKPPDKSYGLWQINMIGRLGPARMKEFGLQREDQLFDPVTNAKAAYAIRKSQGLSAWTIYKNGAYKNHLTAAMAAKDAPSLNISPRVDSVSLSPGNVQAAGDTKGMQISGYPVTSGFGKRVDPISGQAGKNHGGVDISVPSGKPIGLTVDAIAGPPPQFESGYGNFMDIIIPSSGNLYFRMAHFIKPPNYKPGEKISAGKIIANVGSTGRSTGPHIHFEVNKALSGYGGDRDPIPYGKYLTIGRMSGGPTLTGGIRLLHKGEYVIDKDSVDLFGGTPFFSMINGVENEKQRSEKSSQLIQHLSKYTGRKIDQRPEVIVENSDPIIIQGPPTYIASGSSGGSFGDSSGPNWEQDRLELMA